MGKTRIEWADRVWNPVTGCSPVSAGCDNCYAARMATRLAGRLGYPAEDPFRVTEHEEKRYEPLRWTKPSRVFVDSMGDLFHEDVPDLAIDFIFQTMFQASTQTFLILTKRPERMRAYMLAKMAERKRHADSFAECPTEAMRNSPAAKWARKWADNPDANIWLGVSVENQAAADERIPLLLQTPAAVRFISCEPLLGPVDLREYITLTDTNGGTEHFEQHGWGYDDWSGGFLGTKDPCHDPQLGIHWIIAGGESGPGARPMHPDWARGLRDQCQAAGVPFFFKQWGEFCHPSQMPSDSDGSGSFADDLIRCGKKAAGRLLDGREHLEFPNIRT